MAFIILKPKDIPTTTPDITPQQKKLLIDLFIISGDKKDYIRKTIQNGVHFDRGQVIDIWNKIVDINKFIVIAMNGEDSPTTIAELKTIVKSNYNISDNALDYITDKAVAWSDGEGNADFTTFKAYFDE
jgi:hypothetical protein